MICRETLILKSDIQRINKVNKIMSYLQKWEREKGKGDGAKWRQFVKSLINQT